MVKQLSNRFVNCLYFLRQWAFGLAVLMNLHSHAQTFSPAAQVSLLTCSSGSELYTSFGHSAFRVRDTISGVDVVYNYGIFNFDAPNFYTNFIRGKLRYMLGREGMRGFLRQYVAEDRTVVEQQLLLSPQQNQRIINFLENNYLPENRYYWYDFFYDNCSTKLRDILEKQLTDSLRLNSPTTHTKTFRQLLGEKVGNDTWIKLGFDIILGITTDQIAGFRHEMFLPSYLSAGVENGIEVKTANGWQRIMKKKTVLYQAQNVPPPISIWQKPFIWIAAICFFYLLLSLFPQGTVLHRFGDHFLLIICGILGILLLGMLFTDHRPTHYNLNLLWLNPLLLVFIIMGWFGEWWRQMRWMTALAGALIVLLMWFLSPQQFNVCFVPVLVLLVVRSADNLGLFANFK